MLDAFLSEYQQRKLSCHLSPQPHPSTFKQQIEAPHALSSSFSNIDHNLTEDIREQQSHFSIPELPIGQELIIKILSTWGDMFYVGLTGLEVFTASGEQAKIAQVRGKIISSCSLASFTLLHVHRSL